MHLRNSFDPVLPQNHDNHIQWGQLSGDAAALAIANAASKHNGLLCVVVPDTLHASTLVNALKFFLGYQSIPIFHFCDWETLPYDQFSPHQDIISERLACLFKLPQLVKGIVVISVNTLLQRLPPTDYVLGHSFNFTKGERLNREAFRAQLAHCGYQCVTQVMQHGEFAIRGAIIDVFPMGSDTPYRLDLFDNEIDSIRSFEPESQRSLDVINEVHVLPAHEFPMTEDAITQFRTQWREKFHGNPLNCSIYEDVSARMIPVGIEYYLPLFFKETASLLDYLPENTLLLKVANVYEPAEQFWQEVKLRYEQRNYDINHPVLTPCEAFIEPSALFAKAKAFKQIQLHAESLTEKQGNINYAAAVPKVYTIEHQQEIPLAKLKKYLDENSSRILFCAESAGRCEALMELLKTIDHRPESVDGWQAFIEGKQRVAITIAPLEQGLVLLNPTVELIVESQIFHETVMQRRYRKKRQVNPDLIIRDLAELHIGAPVVHIDYGVGRYLGLKTIATNKQNAEYLILNYANDDRVYVPVTSLHLISRYTGGDEECAPLHTLGSPKWERSKRKAAEKIHDAAVELLEIHARREAQKGFCFSQPDADYHAFSANFPYELTPDQQQAIDHVITDMTSDKMMDRLICGDVGFGKTEVAMRAAFIAAHSGRQVGVLVPTTLLAEQHYLSFKERFTGFPVTIELLSRFRNAKEQSSVIEKLKSGHIDIVIGTHRLIQNDIAFKNIGLLIIDEEHRFGVQQKEKLKAMRASVDILTLTATPIPRTLNMSLVGMRDISIIATPPARRLSIKTFAQERNKGVIREAILREIMRGGQVFFLHNTVATINNIAQNLRELIPEAKIEVAHGQMPANQLEHIMRDFYHHRFNVLLCTTIIENGIDIPTANTIIIDRADKFGLAQLHQLRGRVGRSHHQAYAYLMTPNKKMLTKDALKRLDAITSLENLGAGFMLATHDLEIRGSGEILGEEQSGHIEAIGFSLYMELLDHAVKTMRQGGTFTIDDIQPVSTEINLQISTIIPETYLPDVHNRLMQYKRIANAEDTNEIRELQVEMIDRFGLLPDSLKNLFTVTEMKLRAHDMGITKIDAANNAVTIDFVEKPNINIDKLIALVANEPTHYKMLGSQRLRFNINEERPELRIEQVKGILNLIQ